VWSELLDTCVSATGSIQSSARLTSPTYFGQPPVSNAFSPWEVAGANAKLEGWFVFLDSLPICRFLSTNPNLTLDCLNAITGQGYSVSDALHIGRRAVNQLRVFNFRHGLDPALEAPSPRTAPHPPMGRRRGRP
jgi:aldehyde:ferredoxin oxidoreductase